MKRIAADLTKFTKHFVYYFFAIYLMAVVLSATSVAQASPHIETIAKTIRYICYVFFALRIVFVERRKLTWIDLGVLAFALLVRLCSGNSSIVIVPVIIMSLRSCKLEYLYKIALNTITFLFILIVGLSLLGVFPDWMFSRNGELTRHSLGFLYSTDCIGFLLTIVLLYLRIYQKKANIFIIALMGIVSVIVFILTDGRLSFALICLALVGALLAKLPKVQKFFSRQNVKTIIRPAVYVVPAVLFIGFHLLICMYAAGVPLAKKADRLLSGRVKYSYSAYQTNSVPLLGKKIKYYGWGGYGYVKQDREFKYNYVDSSYVRIVLDYGLICALLIIIAFTLLLARLCTDDQPFIVFLVLIALLCAFVEQNLLEFTKNPFMIEFIILAPSSSLLIFQSKKLTSKFRHVKKVR